MPPQADTAERLQKVLAAAGVGSRRACEDLIFRRRVTVNGKVAKLGDKVDPATAEILVDGSRVVTNTKLVYIAMNKPRGVVSSLDDEKGRTELADFLGQFQQRLYHVGRLDADSEGLLLITNDGDLTNKLTHPRYGISKTYLAEVINGPLPRNVGRQLLAGVELEDGLARADKFKLVDAIGKTAHRAPHDGFRGPSREPADPHVGGLDPAGQPAPGRLPAFVERRGGRAVQGGGGVGRSLLVGNIP
jgi:23S rRNA pseudouridine2605 synthase